MDYRSMLSILFYLKGKKVYGETEKKGRNVNLCI